MDSVSKENEQLIKVRKMMIKCISLLQQLLPWGMREIKHQCCHFSHPHLLELAVEPAPTNCILDSFFLSYFLQPHTGLALEQQPFILLF